MTSIDLLQAAGSGDVVWLARLLDSGCDPDVVHPTTGASALYNACFGSQLEAVRLLLARGADPNKKLTYRSPVDGRVETGVVALMLASSAPVVELLLQAGADPKARADDGRTVLMRLIGAASSEVIRQLIRAGADATARANDGRSAADVVREKLEWWQRFAPTKMLEHQADLREILALLEATGSAGVLGGRS
jgi:ankyrin repeat protein